MPIIKRPTAASVPLAITDGPPIKKRPAAWHKEENDKDDVLHVESSGAEHAEEEDQEEQEHEESQT